MAKRTNDASDDHAITRIESPAGRVEVDNRGRSVWQWAADVLESTSVLLKRLENHDLELEPTRKIAVQRAGKDGGPEQPRGKARRDDRLGLAEHGGRDSGGGFDPYNSR